MKPSAPALLANLIAKSFSFVSLNVLETTFDTGTIETRCHEEAAGEISFGAHLLHFRHTIRKRRGWG